MMDTYEKKYKEANDKIAARFGINVAKEIFTDLYESEDERIRKVLINLVKNNGTSYYIDKIHKDDILAWLEKQGEQKPRYSIGDVLCDKSCTTFNKGAQPNFEITDIRNGMYICDKCSFPISQQDEYELVAKRIEQKPTFEMKTPEESLGISSEEYKKIVDTCLYGEKIESKPSWDEEDEHRIKLLEALCEDKLFKSVPNSTMYEEMKITIEWLKSIKQRVGEQL